MSKKVQLVGGPHDGATEEIPSEFEMVYLDSYENGRRRCQYNERCPGSSEFYFVRERPVTVLKPADYGPPTCPHCGGEL